MADTRGYLETGKAENSGQDATSEDTAGVQKESATAATATSTPQRSKAQIFLLMSSLGLAVFLAALDQIIVATALPAISRGLGASSSTYAWIASAYLLANAASIPIWGKVSDIFGRKITILTANVFFIVGSLVSALARDTTALIAGRAVQGIGGGGILVLANICISDIFSLRERGFYLSIIGGVWAIASSLGPIIGGAFAQEVTWRWCFWFNLPIAGLSMVGIVFFLHVHNPRTALLQGLLAIDWLGALVSAGATIMFLMGLDFGGVVFPWQSATVICLIVFGVVSYGVFILLQWKVSRFPLFPLRIFSHASTLTIMGVCFFHAISYVSSVYYLPLYFQSVLGASPLLSGVWILPLAVPLSIMSVVTGLVILKTGHYFYLIVGGMAFLTLGIGLFINLQAYRSWPRIIIFQIIASIGMAPVFQAPIVALQTRLEPRDIASGTSAFQFLRQLSSSISVVIGQVILQSQIQRLSYRVADAGVSDSLVQQLNSGSLVGAAEVLSSLQDASQVAIVKDVLTESLSTMWIFFTCAAAVGLLLSFGIGQNILTRQHKEFKTGLDTQNKG